MEDIATGWLRRWLRRTAPRRTPPRPGPASPAGPPALGTSGSPTSAALRAQAWILEYVNDAAIIIDPHRRILSWNRAAETIYGWTAAAVLGRDLHDVIPVLRFLDGSTLEDVLAAYHREGFWNGEVIQRHRDGHELVIDGTSRVIRDAHGQLAAILAVNRDITARRQVEQALRESEARFRQLFERSPDGIFLIDPLHPSGTWPIVDCNAAAARMHGYTREEIIGQSIHMFSPDPATPNPRQEHYAQLQRAGVLQAEDLHRRKDGSLLHIAYSTSLITLGGRPLVLGIDHDITQRKHAEARLQERERQLAEAQRLAHLGSWTWDLQTDQVQWSDELCRIFGIAPPPRGASLATFAARRSRRARRPPSRSAAGPHRPPGLYRRAPRAPC